jgi:hypothetical protein
MKHIKKYTEYLNETADADFSNIKNGPPEDPIISLLLSGGFEADLGLELLKATMESDPDEFNRLCELINEPATFKKIGLRVDRVLFSKIIGLTGGGGIVDTLKKSREYREFIDLGYELASSQVQLKNGTLVFQKMGSENRLGIFKNGSLRRLLPSHLGKIDPKIKQFDVDTLGEVEMYLAAMRYIIDNIDHADRELKTKKSTASAATRDEKKTRAIEKFISLLRSSGFNNDQVETIFNTSRRHLGILTDINRTISYVRQHLKNGVLPYAGWTVESALDLLSNLPNGMTWIQTTNSHKLTIPVAHNSAWYNFNIKEHLKNFQGIINWYDMNTDNKFTVRILFESPSQIEELRSVFDDYRGDERRRITYVVADNPNQMKEIQDQLEDYT